MQRFLEICATYIYNKYDTRLQNICIVFPNRRAGVFFTAYLRSLISNPVIGPEITTINELLHSLSSLQPADRLFLIARLYEVFKRETGTQESFDDFYFWGEILLADFDDIDKYLVNAGHLFKNISEIKEIERHFDYLSEEQKTMLERFWGSLKNWENREQQRDFVSLWNRLLPVYESFKKLLVRNRTGYSGMIMRDGIESGVAVTENLDFDKYLFVGLNALNACEKKLFKQLRDEGKAEFFWDYDDWYLENPNNDAGKFLRENLMQFPAPDDFLFDTRTFSGSKEIELVSVPSAHGQAQVIPSFYKKLETEDILSQQNADGRNFDRTAVILADESLLFPVLGALPEESGPINVTMGYPVKNAPVTGFLYLLSALLRNTKVDAGKKPEIYFRLATDILNHQLLKSVAADQVKKALEGFVTSNRVYLDPEELHFSPLHKLIFNLPETVSAYPDYFLKILEHLFRLSGEGKENLIVREIVYHVYVGMEKLRTAVEEVLKDGTTVISKPVFFRLMNQYLGQLSVPFEGEPLSGLQVMGILETRCLDFENLIIIGLNEETWPRAFTAPSMIPYGVRKSFGLPGIDDQDAMYAYYFYRLIQRSKRVTAVWNTVREGTSGGELSRYGFQLKMISPHKVMVRNHDYPFLSQSAPAVTVKSDALISAKLLKSNQEGRAISPSAINTWLNCSLRFYFRYVLNIPEPDEVTEEIDRRLFGNIFHKAVENLYTPYIGLTLQVSDIQRIMDDKPNIDQCIRKAFATEFYKLPEADSAKLRIEGKSLLIFSTIRSYIHNLLALDLSNAPFVLYNLEGSYVADFSVMVDGEEKRIRVGGKIDRLDFMEGLLRVIDYKTGNLNSYELGFKSFEELVAPENKKIKKEVIQALVYSLILKKEYYPGHRVASTVYAILKLNDSKFDPVIRFENQPLEIGEVAVEWENHLKDILEKIYSSNAVYRQTAFKDRCGYCPYQIICGRQ